MRDYTNFELEDIRVIRVFVSSTFRDMQRERAHLIKFVFPQLRRMCEQRGFIWGDVDLRWGITDEQLAYLIRLQEIKFQNEFEGVWACASLLHVPRGEMDDVLHRLALALRMDAVCYLSFKEGDGERLQGDRLFTDFTETSLEVCLLGHAKIEIVRLWITDDLRPGRDERWVNALVKKGSD